MEAITVLLGNSLTFFRDHPLDIVSLLAAITGFLVALRELQRGRRERESLSIERRRLAEVNIVMTPKLTVTPDLHRVFVILRLAFQNVGDGPVDMLGVLVSGRLLTSPGAGTGSRDVGWLDYHRVPWSYPLGDRIAIPDELERTLEQIQRQSQPPSPASELLRGASTTRLLTVSSDQYPRLAVKEEMELIRAEVATNPHARQLTDSAYVMHRIFLIARGYSLGEILSQLGGRPRDPLRTVRRQLLQFQPLAQPNYFRWAQVQKALFNINRFAFRLATGEPDPLGVLASPDAWRVFLLHHWDFIDDADVAPRSLSAKYRVGPLTPTTTQVKQDVIKNWYSEQVLPNNWYATAKDRDDFRRATLYCYDNLRELVKRWNRLRELIQDAENYRSGQPEKDRPKLWKSETRDFQVPDEWYPRLIHGDDENGREHRQRWLALMQEGYLINRPLPRQRLGRYPYRFDMHDIPADPRVLEPFVMRTRFFLEEVRLDVQGNPVAPQAQPQYAGIGGVFDS